MPHTIKWYDDEQTIIHFTAVGNVTWDEYHAVYDNVLERIKASPHIVDVIADPGTASTSSNSLPPGNPLPHFSRIINTYNAVETVGNLYVIREGRLNGFVQSAASIAGSMMGVPVARRVKFVNTFDEAVARIKADREERDGAKEQTTP